MRGKMYMDMGSVFDEIFEAARDFKDEFQRNFKQFNEESGPRPEGYGHDRHCGHFNDDPRVDYYPNYSYPPMNVFMTEDRSMVFEFAMAGFNEKDISLSFQGDYMVFSAQTPEETSADTTVRYFKHRLKMRNIEKQKYFVPQDKYAQENVKAVYKNGVLRVSIPTKDEPDQNGGIKVEIIKEGD